MDLYFGYMINSNRFLALVITLIIKIIIVLYVYNDSKSREMKQYLWSLIVFIIPSYIGLIIYLIFRNRNEYTSCPNCHFKIKKKSTICTNCNQILINTCPRCNKIIKEEWDVCPYCTEILNHDT